MPVAAAPCQQSTIHVVFQLLLGSIWNNGLCVFRFYFWFLTLEKIWLPQPIMRIQDPKKIWSRNRSLLNLLCKSAILLTFWGLERGYPMTCLKQPSVQLTWTLLVFSNGPQLHFQCPLPLHPASRARSMLYSSFYLVLFETMGCVCFGSIFDSSHWKRFDCPSQSWGFRIQKRFDREIVPY